MNFTLERSTFAHFTVNIINPLTEKASDLFRISYYINGSENVAYHDKN